MAGFRELIENRHNYAKDWKAKTGGKILGYFCTYVPEELVYAAGILPVRIIGSHESKTRTERHISSMYCAFCRDCLAQGLKGRYSYLDGIVKARSCQHMRQAFASWQVHIPIEYSYYISMPALIQSPSAKSFLVQELWRFKSSLEEWTGKPISDEALKQAIEVYNLNRRLLRQVYELRKNAEPPLSGAEALEMTLSGQLIDKAEHNRLLSEALAGLCRKNESPDAGARLMLIGSENDDIDYIKSIESLGCNIVMDETCTGIYCSRILMQGNKQHIRILVVNIACSIACVHIVVDYHRPFQTMFGTQILNHDGYVVENAEAAPIVATRMMKAAANRDSSIRPAFKHGFPSLYSAAHYEHHR